MAYQMYRDTAGYWRWTLVAANGRKVAASGESYINKQDCRHAITLVQGSYSAPIFE